MLPILVVAADVAGTLSVADRTEVRARIAEGANGADAATFPTARLELKDHAWSYTLGYAPSLTLQSLDQSFDPVLLHAGNARIAYVGRRVAISLTGDGIYGDQNFAYLTPQTSTTTPTQPATAPQVPNTQLLPTTQTIRYAQGRAQLFASLRLDRRWTLSLGPTVSWQGGLDDVAKTVVPVQELERADVLVDHGATRQDHLVTGVDAWVASVSPTVCALNGDPNAAAAPLACSPRTQVVEGTETWRRRLSRLVDASLALGTSATWQRKQPEDAYRFHAYPIAQGTVTAKLPWARPDIGELAADLRVAPLIDQRLGIVDQRLQATVRARATIDKSTVRVTGLATQSLPPGDAFAASFFGGDVEGSYAVTKNCVVALGFRGAWQKQDPLPALFSTVTLLSVTVRADPQRL